HWLKEKVKSGADYIVTQMFFNNDKYFEFVDLCRSHDINVPIIPGLKPLTKKKQLGVIPSIFFVDLPDDLVDGMTNAKTDEEAREVGIEWCIAQSKELKAKGAPCIHYYTMGAVNTFTRIASEVF
ncbi:MAG: methylenetetrahydrofolate reductase, partial [Bacteroidota bacterium]